MTRVRIIGPGRAGSSLATALSRAGWEVLPIVGRDGEVRGAAAGVDLVLIATPDHAIAEVASSIEPSDRVRRGPRLRFGRTAPAGPPPASGRPAPAGRAPDAERGAERLVGAWFGVAEDGDPLVAEVVASLRGRIVHVAETGWVRYHAAAVIASNHLVALLGQAERVAGSVGAPVEAFLDLARGSLADVAALGPRAALTGPVRRGDTATVARHLDALSPDERPAYEAMAREAGRLCP